MNNPTQVTTALKGCAQPAEAEVPGDTRLAAPGSISPAAQAELLRRARQLVAERREREQQLELQHTTFIERASGRYQEARDRLLADFQQHHGAAIQQYRGEREEIFCRYEREGAELALAERKRRSELEQQRQQALADCETLSRDREQHVERTLQERAVRWQSDLEKYASQCTEAEAQLDSLADEARKFLHRWCNLDEAADDAGVPDVPISATSPGLSLSRCRQKIQLARSELDRFRSQSGVWFLREGGLALVLVLALPAFAYPSWYLVQGFGAGWVAGACVLTALLAMVIARYVARSVARSQVKRLVPAFRAAMQGARAELAAARVHAERSTELAQRKRETDRETELENIFVEYAGTCAALNAEFQQSLQAAQQQIQTQRTELEARYAAAFEDLEQWFRPCVARLEEDLAREAGSLQRQLSSLCAEQQTQYERDAHQGDAQWRSEYAAVTASLQQMDTICRDKFPPWDTITEDRMLAPAALCAGQSIPIGQFAWASNTSLSEAAEPHEARVTSREAPAPPGALMPAILTYPDDLSLVLEFDGTGREPAHATLRNIMLRLLTAFPPGKLRFTIVDPVGLGGDFAAFMHLADDDPRLISGRIWTEPAHLQQRLGELTERIETVLQKYLRDEFRSLHEYNAQAGEVAEPIHVLVIADFPANFSEETCRRLMNIVTRGPRCGVYTLMSVDRRMPMPRHMDFEQCIARAVHLVWEQSRERFVWRAPELELLPLQLESPPAEALFQRIVRTIGAAAKHAARVEVPFATIAPPDDRWWTASSRDGFDIALGRAGAKSLQRLRLGSGTSQHVLVAGKTGSGKSSLLHAVIMNLALHYGPDQVEFYLIDFKKGVEFKAYATHRLPHARVIAIESEREFGMSVLERLDVELQKRGELFRRSGVQDLRGYRDAAPDSVLPRLLLVIDEFQEFFTADDRIAHDASLLLDRLVRQGRAFGIHVLLGSQTLSGAYSLARSTLGQIAVRIALQCSEADAHLILSEENTAARWLNRPGEAIYNDANGLLEGNHLFQVAWLPDARREEYLEQLQSFAKFRQLADHKAVVFEGNAAADPAENTLLAAQIARAAHETELPLRCWLGAPVAIKDPTAAELHPQSGNNVLIVGQNEEQAFGMLATSLVALRAQSPRTGRARGSDRGSTCSPTTQQPQFWVLDGSPGDAQQTSLWRRLAAIPALDLRRALPGDTAQVLTTWDEEIERRLAGDDASYEPLFLVLYNLARFRGLKKSDDFGFSSGGGDSLAERFAKILREGPALGMHTLVWSDTYNTANRWFERQTLRDFELRVAMQMSATDSSNFIDSPAASRLGSHNAILYREESGTLEKFRPYQVPSEDWLEHVAQVLADRVLV